MKHLIAAIALLCLGGCASIPQPMPEPSPTQSVWPTVDPYANTPLRCAVLDAATKQRIVDRWGLGDISPEEVLGAQVAVGEGLEQGHLWWVLDFQFPDGFGGYYKQGPYVTDVPWQSVDVSWINIALYSDGVVRSEDLGWTGSQWDRAEAAVRLIASCPRG
ncbi:MAG: hypothetical protein FWD75_04995 [Propionibacteriaceae bacterium]|nr:hypothetical protein [Propionibacteriaceae bacterium]